jgi:hypothetical protein
MFDSIVHAAFWLSYAVPALGALIFLLGTLLASSHLTLGRHHVDDGGDEGSVGYMVYDLAMRSGTLSVAASVLFIPLAVSAVLAFIGTTALASLAAIGLAIAALLAANAVRSRHERYERSFERLAGMTVNEAAARVAGGRTASRA